MMAHQEACQVYIEQEIKEGLAQGKTPSSIGKELAAMVDRLFEASIPPETIRTRARRIRKGGQMTTPQATIENHSEILENQVPGHGGAREGAGRPPKNAVPKPPPEYPDYMEAVYLATIAISQLSRIRDNDPYREKGFQMVSDWLTEKLKGRKL
jgi:hypothetical protein